MSTKQATRLLVATAAGLLFAVVFLPAPLSLIPAVLIPSEGGATPESRVSMLKSLFHSWQADQGWWPWRAWPELLHSPKVLALWMLVAVSVVAFLLWRAWGRGPAATYGGPPAAGKGEHGTARWRGVSELRRSFALWEPGRAGKPVPSGFYLGQGPGRKSAWVHAGEEHALVIGATGSGKSRRVILPTIGVIGAAARESMIVTDPKGELYAHTAEWLTSRGYEVVRFDLREPSRGNRWNPVAAVVRALEEGRTDQASALAWDIAHVITWSIEQRGDPIWPQSQEALIAALILAVAQGEPPPGSKDIGEEPWRWPSPDERHMASVYASLLAGGPGGGRLDDWIEQFPPDHPAYKAYGPVRLSVERTRASILTGAAAELRLFADEEIAWLTSAQDHDLSAPGRRPTAVFLVIPDERSTRYPLATLYVQQSLQALAALADENGGRLPVPVNVILDEFGNLPQIRDFDKTVTVARGRGIRLLLAVQDLAQLKRHYAEAASTIKGNLRLWLYLLTSDVDTAKEISQKLGQYTVAAENLSVPRVTWWTTTATVGTASTTHSLTGRDLLTAEEILRWPSGQVLLIQAGHLPARLRLPDLSAWSTVWPDIQSRRPEPPPQRVSAPPTWRPPDPDLSAVEGGEIEGPLEPDPFGPPPSITKPVDHGW